MPPAWPTRRRAAALVGCLAVLVAGSGCTADPAPTGLPTLGTQAEVCASRVDAPTAVTVIGRGLAGLRELNTFTPTQRVGQCALLDAEGGAALSVQVIHDEGGKQLEQDLAKLVTEENYAGNEVSAVIGDARGTTALWAVDENYYVRVLGLGGGSQTQREAALGLAGDVARRTAAIN